MDPEAEWKEGEDPENKSTACPPIMSIHLMSFCYSVDEMSKELDYLYKLVCGKTGFMMCFLLKVAELTYIE